MPEDIVDRWRRIGIYTWTALGLIGLIAVFFYLVGLLKPVLPPFIYAFIIVYLLRPIVDFFVRLRIPHLLAVIITYVIFIVIFSLLVFYLLPVVINQITGLISNMPAYFRAAAKVFDVLQERFYRLSLPKGTDKVFNELALRAQRYGLSLVGSLPETTTGIFGSLLNIILGPIIAFYLLKDISSIRETIYSLFPEYYRKEVRIVINKVNFIVGGFLRGQALVSLVVGTTIGFYLWIIGVKFAFLLGLLAGILNIIPYFGPIVGGAVAALVALFQSPILALEVIIGMLVIQQFDSVIISPNIMRRAVDLHPALIIFSLLAGGVLAGFLGLLLAIPVAAVAKALVMYYFYEESELAEADDG